MISATRGRHKLHSYIQLTRLDRPIGIYLLLWPTLWALWLAADGLPPLSVLGVFVLGTVLMRSAGCAVNDYADRHVDGAVSRTKNRPLPAGLIQAKEALAVAGALALLAFLLVLTQNTLTIQLSFLAVLLAGVYPFCKRVTQWPQAVLGLAFAMSIPMAYAAVGGSVPLEAGVLFLANTCWTLAYDTLYAMADREDDRRIGIKSSALALGQWDLRFVGVCQGVSLGLLGYVGWLNAFGSAYYLWLLIAAGFVAYQLWLARNREPRCCFAAFLNNHYVGGCVFIGLLISL